ncbi:MAG: 4-(cytidine 5'-diphospho)-2-C-methyl-D-erythritol kinase [Chloroflexi bacterium]|nr:4-(cytidine 5'-diphospho)-2-C-methyl-D-erythritol kinase [Chloroflexota bacterium]
MLSLKAYAKINLTLEVLGKRADGFHEIATVMQTIDLADDLTFAEAPDIFVESEAEGIAPEENLVLKAAKLLRSRLGVRSGARIGLVKRIPVAAGLGGGSTDAAATLVGLCRLWGRAVPKAELSAMAAELGSDVPFFLTGGTALAEGRGERITVLPPLPEFSLVITKPPIELEKKTARLYGALTPTDYSHGEATHRLLAAMKTKSPLREDLLYNSFERVAVKVFPNFESHRRRFAEAGAKHIHLAGSGPTMFALVKGPGEGLRITVVLERSGQPAYLVKSIAKTYNLT